ncbi:MAG: phosphate signaling complex protein PhoU [Proteobacteria bacterium]|nr:phosphate signaling complex protein PhoU [Pseudomonadota bacterium]MDA0942055.1 phosphate signaling complex protein PhoU [Pseudomonadota bacterium]
MVIATHSFSKFDSELETLRSKVLEMGGIVEEQIKNAITALVDADSKLARIVIDTDVKVNSLEKLIDENCLLVLVKRSPAAGDLRFVSTVQKTISDLERIGDESTKIARAALRIYEGDRMGKPSLSDIKSMAKLVSGMLHESLDSFARLDPEVSLEVRKEDEEVDEIYQSCMRTQLTFMLEDPRVISTSLEVIYIAKALERIGDHSENIAEYVVYIVKGADVRHSSNKDIKKELKS